MWHECITGDYIISESLRYHEFEELLLKYFNKVPTTIIVHCCKGIFFHQITHKLLPTSCVLTFTNHINNIGVNTELFKVLRIEKPYVYLKEVIIYNGLNLGNIMTLFITKKNIDTISHSLYDEFYNDKLLLPNYYFITHFFEERNDLCFYRDLERFFNEYLPNHQSKKELLQIFKQYCDERQSCSEAFFNDFLTEKIFHFQKLHDFNTKFMPCLLYFEHSYIISQINLPNKQCYTDFVDFYNLWSPNKKIVINIESLDIALSLLDYPDASSSELYNKCNLANEEDDYEFIPEYMVYTVKESQDIDLTIKRIQKLINVYDVNTKEYVLCNDCLSKLNIDLDDISDVKYEIKDVQINFCHKFLQLDDNLLSMPLLYTFSQDLNNINNTAKSKFDAHLNFVKDIQN